MKLGFRRSYQRLGSGKCSGLCRPMQAQSTRSILAKLAIPVSGPEIFQYDTEDSF